MKKLAILALALCLITVSVFAAAFNSASPIVVVSREEGSGTRGAFVELTGIEKKDDSGKKIDHTSEEALIVNNTATAMTTVAQNDYAIGYISLASLNDTVKAVKIEGVDPTVENILAKTYKISRPFQLVFKGEGKELSALGQDFVSFIFSADGQKVITDNKCVAVLADAPAYQGKGEGKLIVGGSSSVGPMLEKLKEAYQKLNAKADIEIQVTDSTTGVRNALSGAYEIGMASRDLKDSEVKEGASAKTLAMDGIVVIVNKNNPLNDLSLEQVMKTFVGEIPQWDALVK